MHLYNYLTIFLVTTLAIALFETVKLKKRSFLIKSLIAYLIIAFLMFTICNYKFLSLYLKYDELIKRRVFETTNSLFALFEFLFFSSFIENNAKNKKTNLIFKILPFLLTTLTFSYLIYIVTFKVNEHLITSLAVQLNILEFAFLLISCLRYFYFTMLTPIESPAINKNALVTISSVFLYISISLPFLIISEKIKQTNIGSYNTIYAIHYIALLTVFVSLTTSLRNNKNIFYA